MLRVHFSTLNGIKFKIMLIILGSFKTEITVWNFDPQNNTIEYVSSCSTSGESPTWLLLSNSKNHLFSTNEINNYDNAESGAVSCFAITRPDTKTCELSLSLSLVNRVTSAGGWPTHLAININPTSSTIYVSNYFSGNFSAIPIIEDASGTSTSIQLGTSIQCISHQENKPINTSPHAHQAVICGDELACLAVAVVDLGLDEIRQYSIDSISGALNSPLVCINTVRFTKGFGPRHMALHPTQPLAFVLCELANVIVSMRYDRNTGMLSPVDSIDGVVTGYLSTLIDNEGNAFANTNAMGASCIVISKDGRFVYISNRDIAEIDENRSSIVVFEIGDFSHGGLRHVQTINSGGRHPRHFALLPPSESSLMHSLMVVANKDSNNVVVFQVDCVTGRIDESTRTITTSPHIIEPSFVLALD